MHQAITIRQVTLRLPTELAERLERAAADQNRSVNSYATAALAGAVDLQLGQDEPARVRERPDSTEVVRARERAGAGRPLSELISEGQALSVFAARRAGATRRS